MPSSTVRLFTDPDDYAASVRQTTNGLTVPGRGRFTAQIIRIDLHQLWMQRFADSMARIMHIQDRGGRVIISFWTKPGASVAWDGLDLGPTEIVRQRMGGSSFQRTAGRTWGGSMSLPLECLDSISALIAGSDVAPPNDTLIAATPMGALEKLQRLHAAAGHLAENAPEVIANPEAARGLEQSLIEALAGCLSTGDTSEERSARRRHEIIMRRFHQVIMEQPDQAIYVPEICKAIGVAERTLRLCCHEQLGISPKQFLLARRMQMSRRDLRRAIHGTTTVTEIASRYGFWDFGRFAAIYKVQFGELPSATLGTRPGS
jgi:AraC-like DNA-binding protein